MAWHHSPSITKLRKAKNFWAPERLWGQCSGIGRVSHIKYMPRRKTVNVTVYCQMLQQLGCTIQNKQCRMLCSSYVLPHDNIMLHWRWTCSGCWNENFSNINVIAQTWARLILSHKLKCCGGGELLRKWWRTERKCWWAVEKLGGHWVCRRHRNVCETVRQVFKFERRLCQKIA